MKQLKDGRIRIAAVSMDQEKSGLLWDLQEDGSWKCALKVPDEFKDKQFYSGILSPQGKLFASFLSQENDSITNEYYAIGENGNYNKLENTDFNVNNSIVYDYDGSNILILKDDISLYIVDEKSMKITDKIEYDGEEKIKLCQLHDDKVYITTEKEVLSYNINSGEKFEKQSELTKVYNTLQKDEKHAFTTIIRPTNNKNTYICANTNGLYKYEEEITQIVEGSNTTLGSTGMWIDTIEEADDQIYYILFQDQDTGNDSRIKMYSKGKKQEKDELTVYSLHENDYIQKAVSVYRDRNPEIAIKIETGIRNENDNVSDVIRKLNTELLSGKGPDLIILDGLSVNTYADKNVLLDLKSILGNREDQSALFNNITNTYKDQSDRVFAIPTRFCYYGIMGDIKTIDAAENTDEILDNFKSLTTKYQNEFIIPEGSFAGTSKALYDLSLPLLRDENNNFNKDGIKTLFRQLKLLYQYGNWGSGKIVDPVDSKEIFNETKRYDLNDIGVELLADTAKETLGLVRGQYSILEVEAIQKKNQNIKSKILFDNEKVYCPQSTIAINKNSGDIENSKKLLKFLLSKEGQEITSVNDDSFGLPVNIEAFKSILSNSDKYSDGIFGKSEVIGKKGEKILLEIKYLNKQEINSYVAEMKELKTPVNIDSMVEDIILEHAADYISEEKSLDKSVQDAMKKLDIYFKESL